MNQPIQEAHKVRMGAVSIDFHQDADSCSHEDQSQTLTIALDDAGGGSFFILSTARWSVNDAAELADLLNEVKRRLGDWFEEES